MRILAFILLAMLAVTNATLECRLPPKGRSGPLINLQAFRSSAYSVYCAAGLVGYLGLYTVCLLVSSSTGHIAEISQVLTYIDASGVFIGLDANFSFYLVSIANASSAVGRLLGGICSDKTG